MKKIALFIAACAFLYSINVHALGLGKIKAKSALGQPFLAEIELIGTRRVLMTRVKAALANPKDARSEALKALQFRINKNHNGRFIVRVSSSEPISEPYIQFAVDLTWPQGRVYKDYAVLLDPAGYKPARLRVLDAPTDFYEPTIHHENIWQIAQRYKTEKMILPQVALAIVGKNPSAFSEGNLNALKAGMRLSIPSVAEIAQIPADLAIVEAMAHDSAWNEKNAINHALSPPYTHGQPVHDTPMMKQTSFQNPSKVEQNLIPPTKLVMIATALDSLKRDNALFIEQLRWMHRENKKLQHQVHERNNQIKRMRAQIKMLKTHSNFYVSRKRSALS